jgi:hypothetical protein
MEATKKPDDHEIEWTTFKGVGKPENKDRKE